MIFLRYLAAYGCCLIECHNKDVIGLQISVHDSAAVEVPHTPSAIKDHTKLNEVRKLLILDL